MSISREQIRELAEFQDEDSCAVSFYFQPSAPRNKAHKEVAIMIKDLAREAMRRIDNREKKDCARADIDRVVGLSSELRSNGTHGKAVFACAAKKIWREFELPATLGSTQLFVDRHFHLKPIAQMVGATPTMAVVLVDRHRARIFDLRLGELNEREDLFHPLTRRGRSDGFAGYDGGHAQRRVDDEARQHFKNVAETLKDLLEKKIFEKWILACQDAHVSMFEPQLHPYVEEALIGRFHADVARASRDEIRSQAQQIADHWQESLRKDRLRQALDQARSNGRGVTGLRRVLRSLEMGEVQTLLIGENLQAHAVECTVCGHIDAHLVSHCPACGRATQEIVDVGEAILPRLIRREVETFYVKDDAEFDKVGNIAALLRFRSEKVQPIRSVRSEKNQESEQANADYPRGARRYARR